MFHQFLNKKQFTDEKQMYTINDYLKGINIGISGTFFLTT